MALAVKVYLHRPLSVRPNVHRTELPEPFTFDELAERVKAFAEGANVGKIYWRDSEKDLISLKTDEDLRLAADHVRTKGLGLLRVHADLNYGIAGPAAATPLVDGSGQEEVTTPGEAATGAGEASAETGESQVTKPAEQKWPAHKLPGGGQYCGYVRTTGPDGKTIERELTLKEAEQLLQQPSVFSSFDDMWPSYPYRRPRTAFPHPFALPYYF